MHHGAVSLHLAIVSNEIDIAKLLIDYGADINAQDDEGNSVLSVAARNENHEGLRLLLANRALSELKDQNGVTPLQFAVGYNMKKNVDILIKNGADVNAKDNFHHTCLHGAFQLGLHDISLLLLHAGASMFAKDYYENNIPLEHGLMFNNLDSFKVAINFFHI